MTETQPDTGFTTGGFRSIPNLRRFSHEAMATVFDVFITHGEPGYAEQAAWAAFDELDRLETQLSRFVENSDISAINSLEPNKQLRLSPATFECLKLSVEMYHKTGGAFDVTIGSLFDCLLNSDRTPRRPSEQQLELARSRTGSDMIKLNESDFTVELSTEGVRIDLGAVGKGYAVDKMAELLGEWDIDTVVLSAGQSSILPVGAPARRQGWPVTITNPNEPKQVLAHLDIKDLALSGSGLKKGCHIIDPRSGEPVEGKIAAWAAAKTAAEADALSTAFMVMSAGKVKQFCISNPETLAIVILQADAPGGEIDILKFGKWQDIGRFDF